MKKIVLTLILMFSFAATAKANNLVELGEVEGFGKVAVSGVNKRVCVHEFPSLTTRSCRSFDGLGTAKIVEISLNGQDVVVRFSNNSLISYEINESGNLAEHAISGSSPHRR